MHVVEVPVVLGNESVIVVIVMDLKLSTPIGGPRKRHFGLETLAVFFLIPIAECEFIAHRTYYVIHLAYWTDSSEAPIEHL